MIPEDIREHIWSGPHDGMLTNLARSKNEPTVAFTGTTPLVWPWRAVLAGPDRERLIKSDTLSNLNHEK